MNLLQKFIVLSVIYYVSASTITKGACENNENEEVTFWSFDGYPCGNTCENYKVPCNYLSLLISIWSPHCVCKKGFSRLPNGKCVPLEDPECVELWRPSVDHCLRRGNEVFDSGSACQTTCADVASNEPKACVMSIVEDCYCTEGMVRLVENGPCVAKEHCPVKWTNVFNSVK